MAYEFRLPDIGEGLHEAEILEWYVSEGQVIKADDAIAEVQTDKAAVELTSPVGGKVLSMCGPAGHVVKVGELVIGLDTSAAPTASAEPGADTALRKRTTAKSAYSERAEPTARPGSQTRVQASPAVRKLARDLGINLRDVTPTGVKDRLTRDDVRQAATVKSRKEKTSETTSESSQIREPQPGNSLTYGAAAKTQRGELGSSGGMAAQGAETYREPIRGLRKRIYENMTKSMYTAPQVTGMDDLDATGLFNLRQRLVPFAESRGIKLTYLPIIVKAVTHVLTEYPIFNASVDDENMEIVYNKSIHIGIATATQEGLLVPVIRNADRKSVFTIAQELQDLTEGARQQQLKLEELRGSTFTITSTGPHGGWFATPLVNYPEVAILGAHSIVKKSVVLDDDSIVPQRRMGFSLTFDHRIIDGEPAGKFMHRLKEYLESPEAMLAL